MQIAFYAPLKSPNHPVPSGDRLMADLLIKALKNLGHEIDLPSQLRSYQRDPDDESIEIAAREEVSSLLAAYDRDEAGRPDLWFTYHPYYKAVDHIGPNISQALNIPYVTAEASYSPKHDADEWALAQSILKKGLKMASLHFCFTPIDLAGLAQIVSPARLVELPPFIEADKFSADATKDGRPPRRLITVAMMRPGVKIDSYRMLAVALGKLLDLDWTLTIVGDGTERANVESLFEAIPDDRITWTGEKNATEIAGLLRSHDVYLWPGYGEAYGLAYLEAQASGLPVVAQDTKGVPFVVEHGITGLLTPKNDIDRYADAVRRLCTDHELRLEMSRNAVDFVNSERTVDHASRILGSSLAKLLEW